MVKNVYGKSVHETLKLTVSEEWTDGINWFFACWYRFTKTKSWSKYFWGRHGQKWLWLVCSQDYKTDWISKTNRRNKWFSACWYKFRKVKSWFNDFWVGVVKNGLSFSLGDPKICCMLRVNYELTRFCECWWWCNTFWLHWYPTLWHLNAGSALRLYLFFSFN